jgi:acetyl esterase/lipase
MKLRLALCVIMGIFLSGCMSVIDRVGIAFLYKKAKLPASQVRYNIPYEAGSTNVKQQLNLFLPAGTKWPVMVFVYGGAWVAGDKDLRVGGADVYGNIGRFYADHGIGVAVINYRLLPKVKWFDQVDDVAHAVAWVHEHIAEYGGDPHKFFIAGHSAGAQIAARVALDPKPLDKLGLSPSIFCGVITVSGAGLDMTDAKTYELGESPKYFAGMFNTGQADWQKDASPVSYASAAAPPFLIMYCGNEAKALKRQAQRLSDALTRNKTPNDILVVPGQSHARIVLTLSRPDRTAGPAILEFIKTARCH